MFSLLLIVCQIIKDVEYWLKDEEPSIAIFIVDIIIQFRSTIELVVV